MSFQEAEIADATLHGITQILHDALTEVAYTPDPHQIYKNMDTDTLIDPLPRIGRPACRKTLLLNCMPHQADAVDLRRAAGSFCHSNQRQGPVYPKAKAMVFGSVQRFTGVLNSLADADSTADLADLEVLLHDLITDGPATTRLDRQHLALGGKALSRHQMWSYPAGDPNQPFVEFGDRRGEAVNLLGLGFQRPTDELVRWAHTLPDSSGAHQPTAWDSGADPSSVYWRPGGRTRRLDRAEDGLIEVVHETITGTDLVAAIEPLL